MLPNLFKNRSALTDDDQERGIVIKALPVSELQASQSNATLADEISVLSDDIAPCFQVHVPSSSNPDSAFYNSQVFKFHLSPLAPTNPAVTMSAKSMLGPCRYSLFNGTSFPTYNRYGEPPLRLLEHWERTIPNFQRPQFVSEIGDAQVYAYLPCESIKHHVNNAHVHYHLAGKDAIHLMCKSSRTTALLPSTKWQRPCVAKTTHSMASKGIFVIRDDEDEAAFEEYIEASGKPNFVVTEYVDIERNVACHFYLSPAGEVVWFGSNENRRDEKGEWSLDSYLVLEDQEYLKELQLPFVKDVAEYCHSLGFFGFCGVDVLFDKEGNGFLVDVNPRVTGSCPSLMVSQLFQDKYGFACGLFRRSGDICFYGSEEQLFDQVEAFNLGNDGSCTVVIFSICPVDDGLTKINIGVYSNSIDDCKAVINSFAQPKSE
ncbi:hypothetical protein MPSEU_000135200 [Mayamaea pseudoterrestris]|nr:hypothetical protein MPSEU_000135200 [Mayamaea pseudoterrestris]